MSPLKVRKVDHSLGVVLSKDVLTHFNVKEGDQLFLTGAPNGSMRLTPYDPDFEEQMKLADEGGGAYLKILKMLAE